MKKIIYFLILAILFGCNNRVYELAFATDCDNKMDICITNSKNGEIINLTNTDVTEYNLTWTDDGKEIFYTSYEKSGRKVKSLNVLTKSIKTIIQDSTIRSVSDVLKDNSKLIISTTEHDTKGELYMYDIETNTKTRLTNNEFYEAGAKFSPNEKKIVASIQTKASDSIDHSGIAEIFEINISDFTLEQITNLKGFNGLPEYSPNGKLITFHKCVNGICDIYLMNADGSNIINLTQGDNDNRWPRWSPDGKWIAFTKTIDGNSDIFFVSKNGKLIKPVITTEFRDEIAVFKP